VLGHVVAPFGVRGWVRVQSHTEPPDSLLQYREWRMRPPGGVEDVPTTGRRVLQAQWDGNALRAALEGVADRDAAESLRGWEILIEREALPEAAPGEYYREDLLGFTVRNLQGEVLGSLEYFMDTPATPVMIIRGQRDYTVPAVPPHLRRVDLERRQIEVDWPADF
jgi:16S rRNA processing protein RimM